MFTRSLLELVNLTCMFRFSECVFGKQSHELGSSWFADLGPPFGVMHCIRCECLTVSKVDALSGRFKRSDGAQLKDISAPLNSINKERLIELHPSTLVLTDTLPNIGNACQGMPLNSSNMWKL